MAGFWKSSMRDKTRNGSFLGVLFGLLIASSNISWIQSIVTWAVDLIPVAYHFEYISYVLFGILGLIVGYGIDRW